MAIPYEITISDLEGNAHGVYRVEATNLRHAMRVLVEQNWVVQGFVERLNLAAAVARISEDPELGAARINDDPEYGQFSVKILVNDGDPEGPMPHAFYQMQAIYLDVTGTVMADKIEENNDDFDFIYPDHAMFAGMMAQEREQEAWLATHRAPEHLFDEEPAPEE